MRKVPCCRHGWRRRTPVSRSATEPPAHARSLISIGGRDEFRHVPRAHEPAGRFRASAGGRRSREGDRDQRRIAPFRPRAISAGASVEGRSRLGWREPIGCGPGLRIGQLETEADGAYLRYGWAAVGCDERSRCAVRNSRFAPPRRGKHAILVQPGTPLRRQSVAAAAWVAPYFRRPVGWTLRDLQTRWPAMSTQEVEL